MAATVAGHWRATTDLQWRDGLLRSQPQALVEQGIDPGATAARPVPRPSGFRCCTSVTCRRTSPGSGTSTITGLVDEPFTIDLDELRAMPERHADVRHPLRHEVEQVRHDVDGRARPRPVRAGRRAAGSDARDRARRVRLHDERPARRHHHRRRDRRLRASTARRHRADPRWPGARRRCRTCTSGRAPSGCASSSSSAGDRPGFWEQNGYHMYGDPFREQRFTDD